METFPDQRKSGKVRRRLLILVLLLFLPFLYAANTLINCIRLDYSGFDRSAARVLERAERLVERARSMDEAALLASLDSGEGNGYCFRFDDHLDQASCVAAPGEGPEAEELEASFSLRPSDGGGRIEEGVLVYTHSPSVILESSGTLEIDPTSIGQIELRARMGQTSEITFFWSADPERLPYDSGAKTSSLAIWTIPDKNFRTYRVDVGLVMKSLMGNGEPIRKIYLQPNGPAGEEIAIESFRLLTRRSRYAGEGYGVLHETLNGEMRKVLYTRTGIELRYEVEIPRERPMLRFGMGLLEDAPPVTFQATVHAKDGSYPFTRTIDSASAWSDAALELSSFAGQRVVISFSVGSYGENIAFWSNPVLTATPRERFNVVIVLEDALRADRLSCYGGPSGATPVKDSLAAKGALFLEASSQATYTRASCASLMTSLYPSATGVWDPSERLDERYLTLAEVLRRQGFATASFIQNAHVGPYAGIHQGFSTLIDSRRLGQQADTIYGGPELTDWLRKHHDRNFFLYLHLIDPHAPYCPPQRPLPAGGIPIEWDERFDPDWVDQPTVESRRHLYSEEVRNNDQSFGHLLENLSDLGLLGNTLIVFLSDHGEHLAEHGLLWDHVPPGYAQVLHVPLILFWPGRIPEGTRIEQPVQLLDVMPTVLDAAGIDTAKLLLEGNSLLPLARGEKTEHVENRICFSEEVAYKRKRPGVFGSLFYRRWHILSSEDVKDDLPFLNKTFRVRVFHRTADHAEQDSDAGFRVDALFQDKIQSFLEALRQRNMLLREAIATPGEEQAIRYDPATIDELKALGYIE